MAFRASKIRKKADPEPVALGRPLVPNEAVRIWYEKKMKGLISVMMAEYATGIEKTLDKPDVQSFYAEDASPASLFKKMLGKLNERWKNIFEAFADQTSRQFTEKVDETSSATIQFSLSAAGIKEPRVGYNVNVEHTLEAAVDFNHTLITNIQQDAHQKIHDAVMLSLTSPNPEEQGQAGIKAALQKAGDFADDRAKLIARDQNSKLYSSLNVERMRDNGVKKFKWVHSSAGKVPRQTHLDKDDEIFDLDDPRLWEGPKNDQGPPGWAINCRCKAVPVIE